MTAEGDPAPGEDPMGQDPGTAPLRISVLGLGYIGLPTAAMLATHGHVVHGYDVNPVVLDHLERGEVHIEEPGLVAFVRDAIRTGRFVPGREVQPADVYILCVPTPLDPDTHQADRRYIASATEAVLPLLKQDDLVILESTVPAGTTRDFLAPILARSGLDPSTQLHVAHCPETVLPGNMIQELTANARVVGGLTSAATDRARGVYESFVRGPIVSTDATTAEFVKLIQNTYRDVNIALANELALVARDLQIDVREGIRIANHHPRVHLHTPGPGVGGHCIPVDPWFLIQTSDESSLMRTARAVNEEAPQRVVRRTLDMVAHVERPRIAVLGLAYKPDVDDVRESPSFPIIDGLRAARPEAEVLPHDPHVDADVYETSPLRTVVRDVDCILVVTAHRAFAALDPERTRRHVRTPLVFDPSGVLDPVAWRAAGFRYEGI